MLACTACGRREVHGRDDLLAAMPRGAMLPDVLRSLVGGRPNRRLAHLRDRCDTARLLAE